MTHPSVVDAYRLFNESQILRSDMRSGFPFAGVTFEEYAGEASVPDGSGGWVTKPYIEAGEAHAFPLGTIDTFATYFAPADFNETVNTLGNPSMPNRHLAISSVAPTCTPRATRCPCASVQLCWCV